jgi:hypothetical protein
MEPIKTGRPVLGAPALTVIPAKEQKEKDKKDGGEDKAVQTRKD